MSGTNCTSAGFTIRISSRSSKKIASLSTVDQDLISDLITKTTEELRQTKNEIRTTVKTGNSYIAKYNYSTEIHITFNIENYVISEIKQIFNF